MSHLNSILSAAGFVPGEEIDTEDIREKSSRYKSRRSGTNHEK